MFVILLIFHIAHTEGPAGVLLSSQHTHPEELKELVSTEPEKNYNGTLDYLVSSIPLDKLRLTDSVSEKESEKSIIKCSHDMFVEINEKISA